MTGATLTRPPVRHRQEALPMLGHFTTALPLRFWRKGLR